MFAKLETIDFFLLFLGVAEIEIIAFSAVTIDNL